MKFHIKDEDGKDYTVEEIIERETTDEIPEDDVLRNNPETTNETLTSDEIKALKSLAQVAPKLLELLDIEEKEHEENPDLVDSDEDEEDKEEITDEDEEDLDNDKEEIIDTCEEEKMSTHDSKSSVGAIENSKKSVDDSCVDDIATAWAKRYGG